MPDQSARRSSTSTGAAHEVLGEVLSLYHRHALKVRFASGCLVALLMFGGIYLVAQPEWVEVSARIIESKFVRQYKYRPPVSGMRLTRAGREQQRRTRMRQPAELRDEYNITYVYEVDGQAYKRTYRDSNATIITIDSELPVYYDPTQPSRSAKQPPESFKKVAVQSMLLAILLALAVGGVEVVAWTLRRKQPNRQVDETAGTARAGSAAAYPVPLAAADLNSDLVDKGEMSASDPNCLAMLEALCCVMASDGKISRREKRAISQVLVDVHAPLQTDELEEYFAAFVSRVQTLGFRTVLDNAVAALRACADQMEDKQMFLQALSAVAKADDQVDPKERRIVGKLWDALGAS